MARDEDGAQVEPDVTSGFDGIGATISCAYMFHPFASGVLVEYRRPRQLSVSAHLIVTVASSSSSTQPAFFIVLARSVAVKVAAR